MSVGWGCDEGYTEINGECYYQHDLDVLQQFIDNSQEGENPPPSNLSLIDLGYQIWNNGRLSIFCCSTSDWSENQFPGCQVEYSLSGSIPVDIGNLNNLSRLYLQDNQLSGEIPESIGNIYGLYILRLSYNQLSGGIPISIGNLTNLGGLYLHHNQLSGEIHNSFQSLTNLDILYLDSNNLVGSINNLINSTGISSLGISNNMLSGVIPNWICDFEVNWSSGSSFRISNNQFCPPHPSCIEDYMGYQNTSECVECILGDINNDSILNILDIVSMITLILDGEYDECGDVNSDGTLNVQDVVIFVNIILSIP